MKKIFKHFSNKTENSILTFLSVVLSLDSLVLLTHKIKGLSPILPMEKTFILYGIFFVFSILTLGAVLFFNINEFNLKTFTQKTLLAFLPVEMILFVGLANSKTFNYIFHIAAGAYVIVSIFYLISLRRFRWKEKADNNFASFKKWAALQGKISWLIIFIVMAVNLSFGTYNLAKFGAVDEPLWTFDRIPSYWNNIAQRDWQNTNISDKPGITVALISGAGLLFENPKAYKSAYGRGLIDSKENPYDFEKLNFAFRFPLFLFAVLMLPFFYFLIERLLGKTIATYSYISIGLAPILIGMAGIINPDGILWIFGPLSLLSFLVYQKRKNSFYLYLSGILFGLALLTKYVANILSIFFLGLIFIEYVFHSKSYKEMSVKKYLKESFVDYLILFFIALLTFYVFFPASWIKPERLLDGTLFSQAFETTWPIFAGFFAILLADIISLQGKIFSSVLNFLAQKRKLLVLSLSGFFIVSLLFAIANTYFGMKWYDFESIIGSPKSAYLTGGFDGLFFANFFPLAFSVAPITLLSMIFALFYHVSRKRSDSRLDSTIFSLTLFILLYYVATTVNKVAAMNRYQIMVFPIAIILGGIGMGILHEKYLKNKKIALQNFSLLAILFLGIVTVYFSRPFFISYDSPLLPQKYYTDLKDMGTGSYEAAQYINSLPDVRNLKVWTDKKGVCPFLKAKCYSGFDYTKLREANLDYAIVTAGRKARTQKMITPTTIRRNLIKFDTLYDRNDDNVVYDLKINNRPRNYIKIIKLDQAFFDLYTN